MTQFGSVDDDVLALRRAGELGDWNSCLDATRRLLIRLPAEKALGVIQEQVAARLPGFERHQPGVTWPRGLVEAVTGVRMLNSWNWPEDDEFPGPGANNFISAVENLWKASRSADDDEKRVGSLVRAVASAIMAEKLENWGARHIEQWRHWYGQASDQDDRMEQLRLQEQMVFGPEGTEIGRKAWLRLADALEMALLGRAEGS